MKSVSRKQPCLSIQNNEQNEVNGSFMNFLSRQIYQSKHLSTCPCQVTEMESNKL